MSQKTVIDTNRIRFQDKPKSKRTWKAMNSKEFPLNLKFIASRKPYGCQMYSIDEGRIFFYPELDGILVHLSDERIKYTSAKEAQLVAVQIRSALKEDLKKLKKEANA